MKKIYITVLLCTALLESAFTLSPRIESLMVRNYSSQNVIVEAEFNAGVAVDEKNYFLQQPIRDITMYVQDWMRMTGGSNNWNVIKPGRYSYLHACSVRFSPLGTENLYEKMLAFPFMEKMMAIYKKLTIYKEDDSFVITLDTLGQQIIKREVLRGETVYFIEIFDYDNLEAKPASEW